MAVEEIKIPQLGESVTEGSIGGWLKQVGDAVAADEPIVEVETDKVAVEVPSPVAGILLEHVVAEGDTVEIGAVIARIDTDASASQSENAQTEKPQAASSEAERADDTSNASGSSFAEPKAGGANITAADTASKQDQISGTAGEASADLIPMSPAVRRIVTDYNIDPASVKGTGRDGRLTKGDVLSAIEQGTAKARSGAHQKKAAPSASSASSDDEPARTERVKMTRLRKRIAERLKEAQNTAAMLTTFNEVDMTEVMTARARYKDLFAQKHGIKLGFMSFFAKACCFALREVPAVNAQIDGDEIVYNRYANLGVAVSAPNGLVVPVIRDADNLSFAGTELAIAAYGKKARDGKLTMADMTGGTFTISNGGIFGSLMSAPILNPPQSGILGMHKIQERPVVVKGEIVIRPMMYLSLTYDHRIIDGREAVTFLVRVKDALEDPTRLLIDM